MCGLVGCAGNLTGKHDKVIKQLLVLDSLRGEDSTGIAAIQKFTGDVRVAKQLGNPFELFAYKPFENALQKINRAIIGHNRFATQGAVNRRNAHPFEFDTLVGVHNGTLSDKWKLDDAKDFQVDSENLYHHIEKRGLADAISKLGGRGNAWALVWWDKEQETLNFLRNSERTLYYTRSTDLEVVFWASEAWMLETVLARNDIKHTEITLFTEDVHVSVPIDDKGVLGKPEFNRCAAPVQVLPSQPVGVMGRVGNVIEYKNSHKKRPAADESSVKKFSTAYSSDYINAKSVRFEVYQKMTDKHGAEFLCCFDEENPYFDVRLYLNQNPEFEHAIGGYITADVSSYVSGKDNGYFKVSPWTVKIEVQDAHLTQKGGTIEQAVKEMLEDDAHDGLFPTHLGTFVSRKEWDRLYKACAMCVSPVMADDANRFTRGGDCICPGCADTQLVRSTVTLI